MNRRSLRDRDQDAITPPPAQVPSTSQQESEEPQSASTPRTQTQRRPAPAGGANPTTRIGIYFHPEDFTAAKAAYLADWSSGQGDADTFARWIAASLDVHAGRSPAQRADRARPARTEAGSGSTRSFNLPDDTVERARAAIVQDQKAHRWVSVSDWCGDAVATAVEAARERAGGDLPAPPARLPNRLIR